MKKYSLSIPLSGKVYDLAKKCQNMMYKTMSIKSSWIHGAEPHINLISGSTNKIEEMIDVIKKYKYLNSKQCKLIGLGVLITPDPLIFMRFTNSVFLKDLRNFLFQETLELWSDVTFTVKDDIWIPKCTLAFKDFSLNDLYNALRSINEIEFKLNMEIKELSIIDFTDKEHEIKRVSI